MHESPANFLFMCERKVKRLVCISSCMNKKQIIKNFFKGVLMRTLVTLECTDCKRRNYTTKKNKQNNPDRLEMKKYCKWCQHHTNHKETR